jgi:branched-chain amino acid transport system ATP-binding protein
MTAPRHCSEPVLEVRDLAAGYHGRPVVQGAWMHVRRGEIVSLLGRNGSGKTTTLLTIAGELGPLGGSVLWEQRPIRRTVHHNARRGLALVTEEHAFMRLTCRENLRLGRGDVDAALAIFPELEPHLHRPLGLLSGGQQRMTMLARALAARPRVLLVDELSKGLSAMTRARLTEALARAAHDGTGILFVDQHARNSVEFAQRAYIAAHGQIAVLPDRGES